MLKRNLEFERKSKKQEQVYRDFKEIIEYDFKIPNDKIYHFLYYAADDKIFDQIIKTKNNIVIFDFMKTKSKTYLALQNKFIKE